MTNLTGIVAQMPETDGFRQAAEDFANTVNLANDTDWDLSVEETADYLRTKEILGYVGDYRRHIISIFTAAKKEDRRGIASQAIVRVAGEYGLPLPALA